MSGVVTYEGQPVTSGTIFFEPDPAAGNSGPQGIAEFHNGRYETNPAFGARPGANAVRIELIVLPPGAASAPASDGPAALGTVSGVYKQTVQIPATGSATIDFRIRRQDLER